MTLICTLFPTKLGNSSRHTTQCSKWYEISDMDIFQITKENPDPLTNQGAYFDILHYQFNQVVIIKSEEITNSTKVQYKVQIHWI